MPTWGNTEKGSSKKKSDGAPRDFNTWIKLLVELAKRHPSILQDELFQTLRADFGGQPTDGSTPEPIIQKAECVVLHRVRCAKTQSTSTYLDLPSVPDPDENGGHLSGTLPVANLEQYIGQNRNLLFIVFKDFRCCEGLTVWDDGTPVVTRESFKILSQDLLENLTHLAKEAINPRLYPTFKLKEEVKEPYLWLFYEGQHIQKVCSELPREKLKKMRAFKEFMHGQLNEEYEAIRTLLSQGEIRTRHLRYIFIPGSILIEKSEKGGDEYDTAYSQCSFANQKYRRDNSPEVLELDDDDPPPMESVLDFQAYTWKYDGRFEKVTQRRKKVIAGDRNDIYRIQDLPIYPLMYAASGTEDRLRRRGHMFWACRHQSYISYSGWDYNHTELMKSIRFMVDINTLRLMHPESKVFEKVRRLHDHLGPDAAPGKEPPNDEFLLLLPPNIYGFNMQSKVWTNLLVENAQNVAWNKRAFEVLAIDEETKDLLRACVTCKLEADRSTDPIEGKGNGLIILLHGSPGTGKTMTAECVAELAEKPLYRVTCGDIGIDAPDVERYLTKVLTLGKIWGSVILLDEAEVFLQQRNLHDLHQNALVSIFLRLLEFHDGILILTSNRVGTFDEAFKSRIQLAIHYAPLEKAQRRRIWRNLLEHIERMEPSMIDFEELMDYIDELSYSEMNGRQIRNALTTARQLAEWKKMRLNISTLKHAIKLAGRFDTYLRAMNEDLSDEQIAREERIR